MVAVYPPDGSKYVPHSDWYEHESANYRFLSCLLYFNPDWEKDDGGALRMYLDGGATDVLPKAGRLVVFFSRTITHEVLPSLRRSRWAYTLWTERLPTKPPPAKAAAPPTVP